MKKNVRMEKHVKASMIVIMVNKLLSRKVSETTTLEVKDTLRKKYPAMKWNQKFVSECMDALARDTAITYTDNGTFRTYSFKTSKRGGTRIGAARPKTTTKNVTVNVAQNPITKAVPTVKVVSKGPKAKRISKTKALDLMIGNKGRFFTAEFIDKKGATRIINCTYLKDQGTPKLGYVKVKETSLMKTESDPKKTIRQINLQTIVSLKLGGALYKIN